MTVGNSVMDIISNKKFLKNVKNISEYFYLILIKLKMNIPILLKK
jgi:acetylornithine/N-succinyldiaminopimelate aminotransferase